MTNMKTLVLLAVGFATLGCTATYTSIQPAGEKQYFLTRTKNGFFKVSGTLYSCAADGKKMTCSEVDSR
jgi:hypothetical protein